MRAKPLTKREQEVADVMDKMTMPEMAAHFGILEKSVRSIIIRVEIKRNHKENKDNENI